jgi:soluble lytic murein transglycosylase-like protein
MRTKVIKKFLTLVLLAAFTSSLAWAKDKPYPLLVYENGSKSVVYTNEAAQAMRKNFIIIKNQKNPGLYIISVKRPKVAPGYATASPYELSYSAHSGNVLEPIYVNLNSSGTLASRGGSSTAGRINLTDIIRQEALNNDLDPRIISLIIKYESAYNPNAVSRSGAMGLMQLMPGTAESLGVTDAFDPYQNIAGGAKYFKQQLDRFGDLRQALAAYNAGPGAVQEAGGVPDIAETINYVENIAGEYLGY